MKKISFLLSLFLIGAFVTAGLKTSAVNPTIEEKFAVADEGSSGVYNFDRAHTSIGFRAKHMGLVDVPGYFRDFSGTINYDAKDVTKSTVEFTAKMTSVDTGVGRRDDHLRNPDFFEVEKYPEMTFKSTKIEKNGRNWLMTGNLTMKGVTKSVSFPFNIAGFIKNERGTRMGATAETVINRREFGVNYDSKLPNGTPSVSDEIKINLQIEAVMPAPQPTPPAKAN